MRMWGLSNMYLEILLIGIVVVFIFVYTGRFNSGKFVDDNKDLFNMLKESDYEFLLYAKYGDRVVDPQKVFMTRIKNALLVFLLMIFEFISRLNFVNLVI